MHVQLQPVTAYVGTAAVNTQVVVTIPAPGVGRRTQLCGANFSFTGALPAAPVRATITDGTTTIGVGCGGAFTPFDPQNTIRMAANQAVTITLPAGGASAVGDIVATAYDTVSAE